MNKLFHLHIKRDFNVRTTGRLLCVCLSLLLSFSLLTGCGAVKNGGEADGDTPIQPVTVRLSEVTHSVFYAPQYVAISQGFFAQEGLEIELSNGGGADKVMTAVVSGGADIGLASALSPFPVFFRYSRHISALFTGSQSGVSVNSAIDAVLCAASQTG